MCSGPIRVEYFYREIFVSTEGLNEQPTRGQSGRKTVCTRADRTVRDSKQSINIFTGTNLTTDSNIPWLWQEQNPYI